MVSAAVDGLAAGVVAGGVVAADSGGAVSGGGVSAIDVAAGLAAPGDRSGRSLEQAATDAAMTNAANAARILTPTTETRWSFEPCACQLARRRRISSVIAGTTTCRSPITAYPALVTMLASLSMLMAMMFLLAIAPTQCWIAPEIPHAK